jgi:DNA-directed RNA polymerase subunit alpha
MNAATPVDVLSVLGSESYDATQILDARTNVLRDAEARRKASQYLASLSSEGRGGAAKRGVALFVLGRDAEAADALSGNTARGARLVRAHALAACGRPGAAIESLADLSDDVAAAAVSAECAADMGDADRADAAIAAAAKSIDPAEAAYLRGRVAELRGERNEAFEAYDEAIAASPTHSRATFRRARIESLYGDEDTAVELYRRCVEQPSPPRNAWLNLGCIYEDRGEFTKARECFRTVLEGDPTDGRARLFDADAAAAQEMFYDEDLERRSDKRAAILRLPVTDFELSVRSRNCLAKMGVRTLGDLIQKTEAELLSYKNFGETSLQEIKDVLAQKGLRLGMTRDEIARESEEARTMLEGIGSDADRRKVLQKPLAELELSVRSRHCMNVLGLKTVGDLCAKSESELMTIKNFGQTSLNEVKQKLAEVGLGLAPNPVK